MKKKRMREDIPVVNLGIMSKFYPPKKGRFRFDVRKNFIIELSKSGMDCLRR